MQADLRLAGVRSLGALATVLGSAVLALAQFSTARPLPTGKDADVPTLTIAPAKTAPAAPAPTAAPAAATAPAAAESAPASVKAPRAARARWLPWSRLFGSAKPIKVDDPCAHANTAPPSAEELQRVHSGQASMVEVAAAKIKADEAAAPARRAAIRYLASVKCHYFPEAEAALVAALRADRNECVRVDAAQALAECCCCTPKTMEALLMTVSGSERDGNPAEVSERVKTAANQALQRYAAKGMSVPHPDTLPPAPQPATKKAAPKELELTGFTTLPLSIPSVSSAIGAKTAPRELQLTGATILPLPPRSNAPAVTIAERRFAETAGMTAPARAAAVAPARLPSTLPEIRLRPIGAIVP